MIQVTPVEIYPSSPNDPQNMPAPLNAWLGRGMVDGRDTWGLVMVHDENAPEDTKFFSGASYDVQFCSPSAVMASLQMAYQWTHMPQFPGFLGATPMNPEGGPFIGMLDLQEALIELDLIEDPNP